MLNTLRVDLYRVVSSKKMILTVILLAAVFPFFNEIIVFAAAKIMKVQYDCTEHEFTAYAGLASWYMAAIITMILHTDFENGIVRNKLITGKSRTAVTLSYCTASSVISVVMQIAASCAAALSAFILGADFAGVSADGIIRYTLVASAAGAAVSVFFTVLYLAFCNYKAVIALPLVCAAITKTALLMMYEKLYPESGECTLPAGKQMVYTFIDRFVPAAHMTGALRWDSLSYAAGISVSLVICLAAGCAVFERKNIN